MTNATSFLTARSLRPALVSLSASLSVALLASLVAVLPLVSGAQTAAPGTKAVSRATAAQIAPVAGPRYDNKWEIYGGLSFMNGEAGQNLRKRYNMGGGEVMGTYWLTKNLGVAADYRIGLGTTPVLSPFYNRVLVYQSIYSGGVQWRGPRNRYAAINYHALAGETMGTFDHAVQNYPGGSPVSACAAQQTGGQQGNLGLYCNKSAFYGAFGGSIDFNYTPRLAIRLQPDLTLEHFGTELREYVAVSGGVVYRFGRR